MFLEPRHIRPEDAPHLERFDCGNQSLNSWLAQKALGNEADGTSRTYVCFAKDGTLAGYFSLSAFSVAACEVISSKERYQHSYPQQIPCMLIGRLAVSANFQHQHPSLGAKLLKYAVSIARTGARQMGIWAVLVHPIGNASGFYRHYGFRASRVLEPETLYLRLSQGTLV